MASSQSPGLTSMSQPSQEMGVETGRLLPRQLDKEQEQAPLETKVLTPQLVVRESSRRLTPQFA